MELKNHFEVPAPPSTTWDLLNDVPRVIPCMPGAELDEVVDDVTYTAKVKVKIGPLSMRYKGKVVIAERDDENLRVVLDAKGTETRGNGMADALVTSQLSAMEGGGTRVDITTDLSIRGKAARFGRGMVGDVAERFTKEFASNLSKLAEAEREHEQAVEAAEAAGEEPPEAMPAPTAEPARPIGGIRLAIWAVARAVWRGVRRLFGMGPKPSDDDTGEAAGDARP